MMQTVGVDHIGVFVADARKAADWYINSMGFTEVGNFRLAAGHHIIFVHSDALALTYELVQQPAAGEGADEPSDSAGRVDHVAFIVDDVDASFAAAKRNGEDIVEGIIELPELWENGLRYYMVRTAGGERVEFCTVL